MPIKDGRSVERSVHPVRVELEEGADRVGYELQPGRAGDAHLHRQRLARPTLRGGASGRRGLEVLGEAVAPLPRRDHGDHASDHRPDGDRADAAGRGWALGVVTRFGERYQAPAEEPGSDGRGEAAVKEAGAEEP